MPHRRVCPTSGPQRDDDYSTRDWKMKLEGSVASVLDEFDKSVLDIGATR